MCLYDSGALIGCVVIQWFLLLGDIYHTGKHSQRKNSIKLKKRLLKVRLLVLLFGGKLNK